MAQRMSHLFRRKCVKYNISFHKFAKLHLHLLLKLIKDNFFQIILPQQSFGKYFILSREISITNKRLRSFQSNEINNLPRNFALFFQNNVQSRAFRTITCMRRTIKSDNKKHVAHTFFFFSMTLPRWNATYNPHNIFIM